MRLLHRSRRTVPEQAQSVEPASDYPVNDYPARAERELHRAVASDHWHPGNVLTVLAGSALAVTGLLALTRTEINSTWFTPVEQVGGLDHTALLGVIEVGVGGLLVLLGLWGLRELTAVVGVTAGIAAAIAAVDPSLVGRELAIERPWATALAAGAAVLTLAVMMPPWPRSTEMRAIGRRGYGRAAQQL